MGQLRQLPLPPVTHSTPSYLVEHHRALQRPRGLEEAIVGMRSALLKYGVEYPHYFHECVLGNDNVLGTAWLSMARAYLALLNGPAGRLDCGTLDGEIRRWAVQFGFEEEL